MRNCCRCLGLLIHFRRLVCKGELCEKLLLVLGAVVTVCVCAFSVGWRARVHRVRNCCSVLEAVAIACVFCGLVRMVQLCEKLLLVFGAADTFPCRLVCKENYVRNCCWCLGRLSLCVCVHFLWAGVQGSIV